MQILKGKMPNANNIALRIGACAAVAGTAYYIYKYSTSSMAATTQKSLIDIRHQAVDVPVRPFFTGLSISIRLIFVKRNATR